MKTRYFILVLSFFVNAGFAQTAVTVDVATQLRVLKGIENGINLDYLMDGGFTKPAIATATSVKNMGVKLVRYPGGEKADNYLWSAAPWKAASPRMALLDTVNAWPTEDSRFVNKASPEKLCKPIVLDFDELMTLCKTSGAQPLIVVAYDAMYNTKVAAKPTKAQLLANAVEWVRYANVVKKFGIKYWMIGNESWNQPDYNGRTTAAQYAIDLAEFAKAMKAVDPTIKIVANGQNSWWPTLLQSPAVTYIDILAFSLYPANNFTGGYETYRAGGKNLTSEIDDAVKAINTYAPEADKARIKVLAAEYNSIDFEGGWSNDNNLGHALCNFQLFGDMVVNPKVESACMWNTRWTTNQTEEQHIFDALDKAGNLNATGIAQQVWGNNLLNSMVAATTASQQVAVYASFDTLTKNLNIFLLNKDTKATTVSLGLSNYTTGFSGTRFVFSGTSVSDKFPTFAQAGTVPDAVALQSLALAPASVTVLKLVPTAPEVISFTGDVVSNKVNLKWLTENDFNVARYTIERNMGNNRFDSIGVLNAKKRGGFKSSYQFSDSGNFTNTMLQYRLKVRAKNKTVLYSDTVTLMLTAVDTVSENATGSRFAITPNPVRNQLVLQTYSLIPQQATITLLDAFGRIGQVEKVLVPAGSSTLILPGIAALQRGVYWLQVRDRNGQKIIPFVKL